MFSHFYIYNRIFHKDSASAYCYLPTSVSLTHKWSSKLSSTQTCLPLYLLAILQIDYTRPRYKEKKCISFLKCEQNLDLQYYTQGISRQKGPNENILIKT